MISVLKEVDVRGASGWNTFEEAALPHVERLFRHAMWLERNRADADYAVQ